MTFAVYPEGDSREVKHLVYVKRQTRICTTWPTVPITCLYTVFFSTHELVVSPNFLSIRIVLSCFYLLIFHFEKFSTWIWRLLSAVYVKRKLSSISPLATAIYVPETKILKNLLFWNRINAAILNCTSGQELGSIIVSWFDRAPEISIHHFHVDNKETCSLVKILQVLSRPKRNRRQ